jgi:hypothetical protein
MSQKCFIAMGPDGQEFKVSLFRSAEIPNLLPKILYFVAVMLCIHYFLQFFALLFYKYCEINKKGL